jgi:hypothetical protein
LKKFQEQQHQNFKKKCILSKNKSRQGHGFDFEDHVISKYGLTKEKLYTSKFDATCSDGTPVQIKCFSRLRFYSSRGVLGRTSEP